MRYEWDEAKRHANLRKHGIDFAGIERVFAGPTFTILDDRFEYDEPRFLTFGLLRSQAIVVAHTETDEVIRLISARKANKDEEAQYFKEVAN
jgi:uncharacterized DUF497 family protein